MRGVYMRSRKKKSKLHRKIRKYLIFLLLLVTLTIIFFEAHAVPFQEKYVKTQAEILSNNTISEAVENVLMEYNYGYNDIASINYDNNGNVTSIETNTNKINTLKSAINKAVQEKLEKGTEASVSLHIGAFTELSLLSNFGPKVTFDFTFLGSFNSEIISTFESAGLNQTMHHIKLVADVKIITLALNYSNGIEYTTDFEIAQSVIVGGVPSTYANIGKIY